MIPFLFTLKSYFRVFPLSLSESHYWRVLIDPSQGISEAPLPLEPYDEKSLQSRPDEALQGTYREPAYNMDPLGKMLRKNWPQQQWKPETYNGLKAYNSHKRVLELFGRITSVHQNVPEIWQLYSDLSPSYLLKAQRLLKAYRGYTQEAEDKDKAQADQQLSSARLTGQAVLRAAEKQAWPENKDALERLTEMFNKVTEYMKSVM
ncbi:hypothetical protein MSG28_003118 [Choristoneura fumiferana]|uniref:Uncharacterized protein n=1 Tax=Choristoneura fumiferana TaxID=7141 RepID=A0ACC0KE31_CHOFU|nr:hypothetical protein MSG28_003118 [Choristoneura fumiferana]